MMEDFSNSKSVKVNCSFCGGEMECPENLLEQSKKHMCYECFNTIKLSHEKIEDVHVDIPTDKLPETMASSMADRMVDEILPGLWNERKNKLKELSKRDLATELFGAGVYLGVKAVIETLNKTEERTDHTSRNDATKESEINDKNLT